MSTVETYQDLAERPNTRRAYSSAIRHFQQIWHGLLPATPAAVARYLAENADFVSTNTLNPACRAVALAP